MNKRFNQQLEVCHMTLERALQCVSHMKQITKLSDTQIKRKNDPLLDYLQDSLILGQSKVSIANTQFQDLKVGFDKIVKSHDQAR